MNASGTLARVYQTLKGRVMAGEFAPGERIDPARLSAELAASATPIRDALHRLAGERLVESWQQEGFRQPFVSEASLRDLYGWSEDLLRIVVREAQRHLAPGADPPPVDPTDDAAAVAVTFAWIAAASPNHEHRLAIASLNERLHAIRLVEARLLASESPPVAELIDHVSQMRWRDARQWAGQYHLLRNRRLAEIAAQFRRGDGPGSTIV